MKVLSSQISLALGGGGARGAMHIGVYRYLVEHGIEIKQLSGTSAGALIGACIAVGMSYGEMMTIIDSLNISKMIDIDLRTGLLKGKKIRQFLISLFGTMRLEDCCIPLIITSTDINTGEQIVHTTGLLSDVLRASISIPGVFAPYELDNRMLVDGGLIENVPISVLSHEYPVIAISTRSLSYQPLKTSRRMLGIKVHENFLSVGSQILRQTISILIQQNEEKAFFQAQLKGIPIYFVNADSKNISVYGFKHMHKLVRMGYDTMVDTFGV